MPTLPTAALRIVPEFDMPGRSTAWFVGYPEIATVRLCHRARLSSDGSGDGSHHEKTYKFLETFIGEMTKLFPDKYFHIGGDEVNGKEWDRNSEIQDFMHSHNIKSNAELQAYFNEHVSKIVSKNNKIMVGWDEILQPSLPKNIVIQSWRGPASLAQAAKQGIHGTSPPATTWI